VLVKRALFLLNADFVMAILDLISYIYIYIVICLIYLKMLSVSKRGTISCETCKRKRSVAYFKFTVQCLCVDTKAYCKEIGVFFLARFERDGSEIKSHALQNMMMMMMMMMINFLLYMLTYLKRT